MRADFIAVLSAANDTENMNSVCRSWLRGFDLSPNILHKLNETGLTRSFFLPANDKRLRDSRIIFSGGLRLPEAEAETDKKGKLSPFLRGDSDPSHSTNRLAENALRKLIDDPPLPLNGRDRGGRETLSVATTSGKRSNCKNSLRKDPRSFDQLKRAILPIVEKLNTRGPDDILRLGGQSLNISPTQCAVAILQLIEDGQL